MDDDKKYLKPEESIDFREWEKGFESKFWEKLSADLQSELDKAPEYAFWNVKSYEELVAARARLGAIAQLLAYPSMIEQKRDNLITSRRMEAEEQSEDDSVTYL